ncbi:MAG: hypothetical protein BWX71_01354 [Deltaproteobacteria bacterium ADurb.Bin072]|nr:MAG: hypothetical protein BWX71_01354 [Deltaproteobacteria bacterium ADurb.Bin072]
MMAWRSATGMNPTASGSMPVLLRDSLSIFTMAALEWMASDPPRRITALPDFRHSAAASAVTLGLDS